MSLGIWLTIIFMVLKLTHYIDWSWWWVLLPVILEAVFDALMFFGFIGGGIALFKWVSKDDH
jgi:hypothetical protein